MIVNRKTLHACSLFASRETTRPYLCGVYVEAGPWGMRYCATAGHALILLFDAEGKQDENEGILIPTELCKPPAKGEPEGATAHADQRAIRFALPSGSVQVAINLLGSDQYPEIERVIPASGSLSGKLAQFDPALLNLFAEFARRMMGRKAKVRPIVLHNGEEPAIVVFPPAGKDAARKEQHSGVENALGVVMPLQAKGTPEAKEWVRPGWFEMAFPPHTTFDTNEVPAGAAASEKV